MAISKITSLGIGTTDSITASQLAPDSVGLSELTDATGVTEDYHKVPTFANDSARDSAIGSPAVGMIIFNTAAGALQQYNGTWSTIATAPNVTGISGFLNEDTDSTLTIFGSNFNSATSVKIFDAASGGGQLGSGATVTFVSTTIIKALFGGAGVPVAGNTAYIEVDNSGVSTRFATAITVNADPVIALSGNTGTGADTTDHLGTYGGLTAGGGDDSNTVFLLNFDRVDGSTDFEESSNTGNYGHKVTAGGGAHIETDQYKFGTAHGKTNNTSAYFDGNGDYLTIPDSNDFHFADGNFTVDFWIRKDSSTYENFEGIIGQWYNSGSLQQSWLIHLDNDSKFYVRYDDSGNSSGHTATTGILFTSHDDKWTHIAVVRNGANMYIYFDGVLMLTHAMLSGFDNAATPLIIGGYRDYYKLKGYLDSVRISKGIARWTAPFNTNLPTAPYGTSISKTIPTITLTGTTTPALASDEDIEYTSVANTTKAANNQHLTDSGIGLTLTNTADSNLATLTGTIASAGGTTHTNMPMKAQVRKTLGNAAYANAARTVTFSSSTTTIGLAPAMPVTGTGIPANTTITSVDSATVITLSANPTGGTLTGQSLVFLDLTRITHINGSDTLTNADAMMTIATATGEAPVLFNARRYIGNTTGLRQLTGFGFQPDLVWIKDRGTTGAYGLFDIVRGTNIQLSSNANTAADTGANYLSAFGSDGFTLGQSGTGNSNVANHLNGDDRQIVSWGWKAGGAPSADGKRMTDGTETNLVSDTDYSTDLSNVRQSVNSTGKFSITKFNGATGDQWFLHGLGAAKPDFYIIKQANAAGDWRVWHSGFTTHATNYITLNEIDVVASNSAIWADTGPETNGKINAGGASAMSDHDYICYAWKAVAEVSAFGSYTGASGGAKVTLDFRPKFILVKMSLGSATAFTGWTIIDVFRSTGWGTSGTVTLAAADVPPLTPNEAVAEGLRGGNASASNTTVIIYDDGFKFTSGNEETNTTGSTYIYAAFA